MSYCNLKCGVCGHYADLYEFTKTPIFGSLPAAEFQCPVCNSAFRRESAGAVRVLTAPGGQVMAFREKTELRRIEARL